MGKFGPNNPIVLTFIAAPICIGPEPLPINEPFTAPSAIPDDWDIMGDDLLGSPNPATPAATIPPSPTAPPASQQQSQSTFPETQFEQTSPLIPDSNELF